MRINGLPAAFAALAISFAGAGSAQAAEPRADATGAAANRYLTVIATARIKPGRTAEFEAAFADLAREVRKEPGTLVYQLSQSRTDPNVYKVLEMYKDKDAEKQHTTTDYFKAAMPKLMALLAAPPELEYLDGVK